MKGTFPLQQFHKLRTPFYYYDTALLRQTLDTIRTEASRYENYAVHYAVKANANPKLLTIIRESGLGADCVSGGEIRAAVKAGFPASDYVGNQHYIFNIRGNRYRLVVVVKFTIKHVFICWVGTHEEYNSIDCTNI